MAQHDSTRPEAIFEFILLSFSGIYSPFFFRAEIYARHLPRHIDNITNHDIVHMTCVMNCISWFLGRTATGARPLDTVPGHRVTPNPRWAPVLKFICQSAILIGMQITRETDYAIRSIYYLAEKAGPAAISEMAESTRVPADFLAKILQKLAKAGIVKSRRGVKGGFELAKKPAHINFLEVVEAVEGPVAMNICALDEKLCSLSGYCTVHPVWTEVRQEVRKLLAKKNFAQVLSTQKLNIGCQEKVEAGEITPGKKSRK